MVERGNGCNHLSAFASAPFITGPDVVLVVDASVVFSQFPPKSFQVGVRGRKYLTGAREMGQSYTYK